MKKFNLFFRIITLIALPSLAVASAQEVEILNQTNLKRAQKNLKPLKLNDKLTQVACAQSILMAKTNSLSHDVHGQNLTYRVENSGYTYQAIAENIALSSHPIPANAVVKMWMNSSSHRRNILNHRLDEIGIGISVASNGGIYYTQVFGRRNYKKGWK